MVKEWKDASGTTPATAGRTPHAESNSAKMIITYSDERVDRAIQFDDFEASDQDSEEDGNDYDNDADVFSHESEERSIHVRHVSNPRGVDRRQADDRDEEEMVVMVCPMVKASLAHRATMNAETPLSNRDICRLAVEMENSRWIQLFRPRESY